ncbi:MAG: GLPGLI family protein [Flavobacterium sp.]
MKILFFLFFFTSVYPQYSGIVHYKVLMPENKQAIGSQSEDFFNDVKKIADKQIYILKFNASQSHFYLNEEMKADKTTANIVAEKVASVLIGGANYYDREKQISINENTQGVLLEDKFSKDWIITPENKKIGEYLCYKATYTNYFIKDNKTKSRLVTAWFAPSLPYPFGPKGYNGLPGLVLELIENDVILFVDVIDTKVNPITIKFPKGKVITVEEYMKNSTYIPRK